MVCDVAVQPLFCDVLLPGFFFLIARNNFVLFLFYFFFVRFVSVKVVHSYGSIDIA